MKRALVIIALGGCELIAGIPDPAGSSPSDARTDASSDGTAPTDAASDGVQPECLVSPECTTSAEPVCGADHTCRECLDDPECGSGVCLPDGTCADPGRFVYAAPTGSGGTCSAAAPCSVDTALTRLTVTTDIVKLAAGTYSRSTSLALAGTGILAGGGATFTPDGLPSFNFMLTASSGVANLTLLGLTVAADGTHNGIACQNNTLRLVRTKVTNGQVGLSATGCALDVDRATFSGMNAFAIYAASGPLSLRNSYIVGNGKQGSSTFAVVYLNQATAGLVEHTTVASNGASPGIQCDQSPAVRLRNMITWGNAPPPADATLCVLDHSVVEPGFAAAGSNLVADPLFVDAAAGNFHLTAASPARGAGDPLTPLLRDADGDPRPNPAATPPDVGADEIP